MQIFFEYSAKFKGHWDNNLRNLCFDYNLEEVNFIKFRKCPNMLILIKKLKTQLKNKMYESASFLKYFFVKVDCVMK